MLTSVASLSYKLVAVLAALALMLSMVPLAWADDGSAATAAGIAAGNAEAAFASEDAIASDDAPEASAQSADAKAAGGSGSAGGTTVSIQVYRSSFPIMKWDLNDDDFGLTKAAWTWVDRTSELPQRGTPGQEVEWPEAGKPSGYAEPTRTGFEFAGWSTGKSAPAGGFIDGMEPKLSMPDGTPEGGEYVLYALWTPLEYAAFFDLAKNPDIGDGPGSDATFALNWPTEDGIRTVTSLESGCYRVSGFTMAGADYDSDTRTVRLPEPARTGYRFLGWAEAEDTALLVVEGADGSPALNPVRLPQIDGIPVLTARWASAFGVTAPLSITFGDYDKTGTPGNPSMGSSASSAADDTTQSEADDVETPGLSDQQRYEGLHEAYFENTGWAEPIKMVSITSKRDPSANQVLTTYDSSKATEAAVLGDGTAANPGERLLSLYPAASAPDDKATGIHFRLSDSLTEDDLAGLPSIAAHAKQPVTYGLNLSTDPMDGSPNHGLVLETQDYERKQIATVSYTFAVAQATSKGQTCDHLIPSGRVSNGIPADEPMFFTKDGFWWGFEKISAAASHISETNGNSDCCKLYDRLMRSVTQDMVSNPSFNGDSEHFFQLLVNGSRIPVQLIGICDDTKANGSPAGLTFMYKNSALSMALFDSMNTAAFDGWCNGTQRNLARQYLQETFINTLPSAVRSRIALVIKHQQFNDGTYASNHYPTDGSELQGPTYDTMFIPSCMEVFGDWRKTATGSFTQEYPNYNGGEVNARNGYIPFRYDWFAQGQRIAQTQMDNTIRTDAQGNAQIWWLRTAIANYSYDFVAVYDAGGLGNAIASLSYAIVPCFCL